YLRQALEMYQQLSTLFFAAASEAEALNFEASLPRYKDGLISACLKRSEPDDRLYPLLWRSKAAITLVTQPRQRAPIRAAHPADQARGRAGRAPRRELARLALAPAGAAEGAAKRLRALTERKEDLERQLAERLPEFRRQELLARRPAADLEQKLLS